MWCRRCEKLEDCGIATDHGEDGSWVFDAEVGAAFVEDLDWYVMLWFGEE